MKALFPVGLRNSTTRAEVMEIRRRDGRVFRFTTHDVALEVQGRRYRAGEGFDRSAIGSSSDFTASDAEVRAFFDSVGLTAQDISLGKFDGARIKVLATDFTDTTLVGEIFEGFLGTFGGGIAEFDAQILSYIHVLEIDQGEFTTPECPVDLGEYRCTIPINPFVVCRDTPYTLGQFVKVITGATRTVHALTLTNADFNAATLAPWTTRRGNPAAATSDGDLVPFEGARFLGGAGTSIDGYIVDRIDDQVAAAGSPAGLEDAIDEGRVTYEADIQRANGSGDARDSGAVRIEALDEDGNGLAVLWDYEATTLIPRFQKRAFDIISPADEWQIRSCAGRVLPATTRLAAVILDGVTRNGSKCNSAFDRFRARLIEHDVPITQEVFENRIYEVTTAGTTASTQPTFDTTPGNTTTDGTVVFTCREAWTRDAEVDVVVSPTVLQVTVDESRASADGWFENGILIAESGDNAVAQGARIKSWNGASQQLTLFVPFPFAFQAGDKLILVKGCRKRPEDCQEFAYEVEDPPVGNIANYQGFPTVPGTDAISQTPAILTD